MSAFCITGIRYEFHINTMHKFEKNWEEPLTSKLSLILKNEFITTFHPAI